MKLFQDFRTENWPESSLECLMCAELMRQRRQTNPNQTQNSSNCASESGGYWCDHHVLSHLTACERIYVHLAAVDRTYVHLTAVE